MTIIYTQRGFAIDVPLEAGSVYESPIVSNIWHRRKGPDKPNFSEDLVDIAYLLEQWKLVGGLFNAYQSPLALVVASTQGYINETTAALLGKIPCRRVGFNDWTLLLSPVAPKELRLASFLPEERERIKYLSELTPEALFQKWINVLGLQDLVDTLQLFVGHRDEHAR